MNEDKKEIVIDENDDRIRRLIERLVEDDSWEEDRSYRIKAAGMLLTDVFQEC